MEALDVLIVGAGISGICAAHALSVHRPAASYAIVEARAQLGGTWDLFRYPGIRSDSDMFTLGYSFRPWRDPKAIADGPAIRTYLEATAEELGITEKIRFGRRVESVSWSSAEARWTARIRRADGEAEEVAARFLWVCAGYYRYDQGYTPSFAGVERFRGRVVHPQHWPEDLDVKGKRVVVIGSGATAVTLVPALAGTAESVVMLQRSPTYVASMPSTDAIAEQLRAWLPERTAYAAVRWKNIAMASTFYRFCQRFPGAARRLLTRRVRAEVGDVIDVDVAFNPTYGPWDQRLCLVPDGDLFRVLREGRARIVTGTLATFTEHGVALEGGEELPADVVITATGLELQFLGGARVDIDGVERTAAETQIYMGTMLSGVPNLAFVMGYTNASWTLKCELVCDYVARLLRYMADHGHVVATPRADPSGEERPAIEMTSGYFARAAGRLPKQGGRDPWRLHQDFFADRRLYRRHPIADGVLDLR